MARCSVERLMRGAGLEGARRGKVKRTMIAGPAAERPVRAVGAGPVVGGRHHVCVDVVGLGLRRIGHRCLCPHNCGLAFGYHDDYPAGAGRVGAGDLDSVTRRP